MMFFVDNIRC